MPINFINLVDLLGKGTLNLPLTVEQQHKWLLTEAKPGDIVFRGTSYQGDPLYGYAMVLKTKKGQTLPLWLISLNELNLWIKHGEDPFGMLKINNEFNPNEYLLWLAEKRASCETP
jgi:hypothetical protein